MAEKIFNVGVFPCGSEVGLEISRALKYSRHFNLIGLNSVADAGRMYYKPIDEDVPFITSDDFIEIIKQKVKKYNLDYIIPAMDEAGYILKVNEVAIGCEIVYNNVEAAEIIRKKSTTYAKLQEIVSVPKVYTNKSDIIKSLPVFSKYDIGYGSRGAYKVRSEDELESLWIEFPNRLFTEYLEGEEYTIDCFSNKDSEVLFAGARQRSRIRMGISVGSNPVYDPEFSQLANKISQALNLQGIWFFQVKKDKEGIYKLLEVASRVSGSMALYRIMGVNFILLDLFQRSGYPVSAPKKLINSMSLERSFNVMIHHDLKFNHVYVDFDDCLILGDKVNSQLLAFIFQCLNRNKKVYLITRHKKDINKSLDEFRLHGIFDEIIHITDASKDKSFFIKHEDAIFIDDSFRERKDVSVKRGIPVFAPDAIPALINSASI